MTFLAVPSDFAHGELETAASARMYVPCSLDVPSESQRYAIAPKIAGTAYGSTSI